MSTRRQDLFMFMSSHPWRAAPSVYHSGITIKNCRPWTTTSARSAYRAAGPDERHANHLGTVQYQPEESVGEWTILGGNGKLVMDSGRE